MNSGKPLISEDSALYLASVLNRIAASFDVSELTSEEAIEAWMFLNSLLERLGEGQKRVLLPLFHSLLDRLAVPPEDDEPEGNDGDLH